MAIFRLLAVCRLRQRCGQVVYRFPNGDIRPQPGHIALLYVAVRWLWKSETESRLGRNYKNPLPFLGHAIVASQQNLPLNLITKFFELLTKHTENATGNTIVVFGIQNAFDLLHEDDIGIEGLGESGNLEQEHAPLVCYRALFSYLRERLTRRTAKKKVDFLPMRCCNWIYLPDIRFDDLCIDTLLLAVGPQSIAAVMIDLNAGFDLETDIANADIQPAAA